MDSFAFENIGFTVGGERRKKGQNKTILNGISYSVKSGHMVSIMGPSGSGKTTLLNILTLRALYGQPYGKITLNGKELNGALFQKKCFHVGQFDKNWSTLTVYETLMFAAKFFSNKFSSDNAGSENLVKDVEDSITSMGLNDSTNTRCSGLSGGQQRRLSIAIALLKKPSILFLDEPTSGLDSLSATKVCEVLRNVTDTNNIIVFCTIHQPSTRVFNQFDELMLLSKGQLAYAGSRLGAETYFQDLGFQLPPHMNPAEYYIDMINSDFGNSEKIEQLLNVWSSEHCSSDTKTTVEEDLEMSPQESSDGESYKSLASSFNYNTDKDSTDSDAENSFTFKTPSFLKEVQIMLHRHSTIIYHDPVLYIGRCVAIFITNCIFSLVYWKAREWKQDQALNKFYLIAWQMAIPILMSIIAVNNLHEEIHKVRNEYKNGMVKPLAYVIAKLTLTLPIIFIMFSVAALAIPGFIIQKYNLGDFVSILFLWSLSVYLFESVAECIAVWISDKTVGMILFLLYWVLSFLFAGIFLREEDIFWPLKLLYYIMPFKYHNQSMTYRIFHEATFDICDPKTNEISAICVNSPDGSDVLKALGKVLPVVKNPLPIWRDPFILFSMVVFFKIMYVTGFILKGNRISIPKKLNHQSLSLSNKPMGSIKLNYKSKPGL